MALPPICAPATPLLPSAIAVVRVSGRELSECLAPLLRLPEPRRAELRVLAWEGFREQALVLFFPAPASYTGEDVVEFQLHGNPLLVRRFLEHLGSLGIRLAEPGEFTRRALLNGKQDLLGAEALRDLLGAETDQQLRQAQARGGHQPAWIGATRARLAPWIAQAEAAVDYGEDEGILLDLRGLKVELEPLRAMFHMEHRRALAAHWLRDGIRVVLVGRPNAGKSTLFNALAGEERAIVTEEPGTTRDVLEVKADFAGLPLLLFDTAGLRDTENRAEGLGIARIGALLERADLIVHLVPVQDPVADPEILARLAPFQPKVVEFLSRADEGAVSDDRPRLSAATGELTQLASTLRTRFLGEQSPESCLGALATARQRELLSELMAQVDLLLTLPEGAPPELPASLLQGAWSLLLRLTGEDRAEATLDQVFGQFCLGK